MTSPIDIRINMDGVPRLMTILNSMGYEMPPALMAGAEYIRSKIATYPPVRHDPQPFKNAKQRRGFFAKLNAGEIDVPYIRGSSGASQKLGQSWRVDANKNDVIIGTEVGYAPLVQSAKKQTRYHALTGWVTDRQVKADHQVRALSIVEEILLRDLVRDS